LRCKSLAALRSFEPAAWLATKGAGNRIVDTWRAATPIHAWLNEHVGPSTEPPDSRW
ncbi:MAG: hypothetical protein JWM89_3286, partial [Acidimicrobiales bacterium]|nr:hypothetical protein [Acidimicrobiales bacterium]